MFLALRDIRFAKGRFALMGGVVALITLLLVMLSGLTAGLGNQSTSAIAALPADHIVFGAPAGTDPPRPTPSPRSPRPSWPAGRTTTASPPQSRWASARPGCRPSPREGIPPGRRMSPSSA